MQVIRAQYEIDGYYSSSAHCTYFESKHPSTVTSREFYIDAYQEAKRYLRGEFSESQKETRIQNFLLENSNHSESVACDHSDSIVPVSGAAPLEAWLTTPPRLSAFSLSGGVS